MLCETVDIIHGSRLSQIEKLISNVMVNQIMSQRLGMADGRQYSLNSSAQLLNNHIMQKNGVQYADNYSYRQLLQKGGPAVIEQLQKEQAKKGLIKPDTN